MTRKKIYKIRLPNIFGKNKKNTKPTKITKLKKKSF